MSNHNRKRKHRGPGRTNHHRNQEYSDFQDDQPKFPAFLSHHEAYQASLGPLASSSNLGGYGDTEMNMSMQEERERQDSLQALYIQAYEADIIRGPNARTTAQSLEVVEYVMGQAEAPGNVKIQPKIGSALIQLQLNDAPPSLRGQSSSLDNGNFASESAGSMQVFDEDEDDAVRANIHTNSPKNTQSKPKNEIWVDRYDARLLLDALPTLPSQTILEAEPSSPTGWSDLSSDAEDTFFFDPSETEDFRKEKRRRLLEKTREERLRARREEDGDAADEENRNEEEEEVWGGSDEEPDQTQKDLMSRTATHLLSSPNPAQLEMRILANHGRDRRFAFLRGRWSKAWGLIKAKARLELAKAKEQENELKKKEEEEKSAGLGLLAGYGSGSDEDDDQENQDDEENKQVEKKTIPSPPMPEGKETNDLSNVVVQAQLTDDEEVKEARRKRLKLWSEQRKAAREKGEDLG